MAFGLRRHDDDDETPFRRTFRLGEKKKTSRTPDSSAPSAGAPPAQPRRRERPVPFVSPDQGDPIGRLLVAVDGETTGKPRIASLRLLGEALFLAATLGVFLYYYFYLDLIWFLPLGLAIFATLLLVADVIFYALRSLKAAARARQRRRVADERLEDALWRMVQGGAPYRELDGFLVEKGVTDGVLRVELLRGIRRSRTDGAKREAPAPAAPSADPGPPVAGDPPPAAPG